MLKEWRYLVLNILMGGGGADNHNVGSIRLCIFG